MNFENFTFGSQQLIVFHIDPGGAAAAFDTENLVQFAQWSARDRHGPSKARNNAFLNPEVKSWAGMEVLVLENWYVDDDGRPILPPLQLHYTMNLHLLMRCVLDAGAGGLMDVPIVLDPDTGNMGGEP